MEENNISTGINIDGDSKRTYPLWCIISNVIGFFGNDKGFEGVEAAWEDELSGTPVESLLLANVNRGFIL